MQKEVGVRTRHRLGARRVVLAHEGPLELVELFMVPVTKDDGELVVVLVQLVAVDDERRAEPIGVLALQSVSVATLVCQPRTDVRGRANATCKTTVISDPR